MEQNDKEENYVSNDNNKGITIDSIISPEITNTNNENKVITTIQHEETVVMISKNVTTNPEETILMPAKNITTNPEEIIDMKANHVATKPEETLTMEAKYITTKSEETIDTIAKDVATTKPEETVVTVAEEQTTKPEDTIVLVAKHLTAKPKETIVMMAHDVNNDRSGYGNKFSDVATYNIETQRDADGGGKKVYYDESTEAPLEYHAGNRNDFVRKVCVITFLMLAVTAGFMIFVLMSEELVEFFKFNRWLLLIPAMGMAIGINYAMFCSMCSRKPPCNIVCLVLNTIAYCIITAVISVNYKTEILFYAFLTTSILVFVCIILAMSSFDFTSWLLYVIGLLVVVSVIALALTLVQLLTETRWKPVQIGLLFVMTLLQSVMLIIELQMILGGRQVELGEDDYALGAFMLYNSIVELFLKIVQILGLIDSD